MGPGFTSRSGSPGFSSRIGSPVLPPEVGPPDFLPEVGPRFYFQKIPFVVDMQGGIKVRHSPCDVSVRGLFTSGLSGLPQRATLWTRHQCFGRAQCLHLQGRESILICHSLRAWFATHYHELQRGAFSHNAATADFDKTQDVISQCLRALPQNIYRGPTNKSIFNILGLLQECPEIRNTDFWLS